MGFLDFIKKNKAAVAIGAGITLALYGIASLVPEEE